MLEFHLVILGFNFSQHAFESLVASGRASGQYCFHAPEFPGYTFHMQSFVMMESHLIFRFNYQVKYFTYLSIIWMCYNITYLLFQAMKPIEKKTQKKTDRADRTCTQWQKRVL